MIRSRVRASTLRDLAAGFSQTFGRAAPALNQEPPPLVIPQQVGPENIRSKSLGPNQITADSLTAAEMAPRVRQVQVPIFSGIASTVTAPTVNIIEDTTTRYYQAWTFVGGSSGIMTSVAMPRDATATTYTENGWGYPGIKIYWAPSDGTASATVTWKVLAQQYRGSTSSADQTGGTIITSKQSLQLDSTTVSSGASKHQLYTVNFAFSAFTASPITLDPTYDGFIIEIQRRADAYAGNALLVGAVLVYYADM